MKKILSIVFVMLLCLGLAAPAYAAEPAAAAEPADADGFVPSVHYKPTPEFVPVFDDDGNEYIGVVRDEEGEVIGYVEPGCLIVTPIAHVWDEDIEVPQEIEDLLLFLYASLNDGSMTIPYEKHNADLDPANMVIRDLFDARWGCEEHPKMLAPQGVVLELTFDLGVVPEAQIYVQTYDEATGVWEPIVSAVNNGDGTVTCIFEHLCGIEFSMPLAVGGPVGGSSGTPVNQSGRQEATVLPWVIVMILAAVSAVAVLFAKKKKKSAA